jgi:hypothetical protein
MKAPWLPPPWSAKLIAFVPAVGALACSINICGAIAGSSPI